MVLTPIWSQGIVNPIFFNVEMENSKTYRFDKVIKIVIKNYAEARNYRPLISSC